MKLITVILSLLFLFFTSCKKDMVEDDYPENESEYLTVSPTAQYIHGSGESGKTSFTVKSNTSWTVTYNNPFSDLYGSLKILSVEPSKEKNNATVIVRYKAVQNDYGSVSNEILFNYTNSKTKLKKKVSAKIYSYKY